MVQIMQNSTERPSAIVCIAYRQSSIMTGSKDPTEQPMIEQIKPENVQINTVVKTGFPDLTNLSMDDLFQFSKDMADCFRRMLDDLRVRIEQFQQENRSIFDLLSFSQLQKWIQGEQ